MSKPTLQEILQYTDSQMNRLLHKRVIPFHEEIISRLDEIISHEANKPVEAKYDSYWNMNMNYLLKARDKHFKYNLDSFKQIRERI
jgi:hypothetical protein